jgi:DNA primase
LTEHHLYLLTRYSRRIVLALDPDAAGDRATLRGLQIARQTLDREADPVFDARGLMRFEARLQADIRVTTLPEGMDPDEVVQRDVEEWERILQKARPIVEHVMETLASGSNLQDAKVKDEIAAQVLPLIRDIPSPIERDTYRQRLARLLRVDERTLMVDPTSAPRPARQRAKPQRIPQPQAGESQPAPVSAAYALESHILGVLLRRPDLLYRVDRMLQELGLGRLSQADFQHADHQAILRLLQASVDQDMAEPLNYVLNSLSLPMMEIADGLLARTGNLNPNDERVLEDILRGLITSRQAAVRQNIDYLRYLMEDAQQQGSLRVTQYQQTMVQHNKVLLQLDRAMGLITSRETNKRAFINKAAS